MLTTPERRHSERARIPCHIPVELTDAARAAQFEADAVDLSMGGLSLRASQLPDLGSQLFCTFEAMPGGAQILGRGVVVWRQPSGEQGGEFGLRFIEVDARNQALIDEMVAERIARIAPREKALDPVVATLEIENVDEPATGRLVHAGDNQALFEQTLSQFAVGKAVVAHAGPSLVRGHVASVEIRMEGTTPRLLVNLELARDPSQFGEFMWGEPGSDTDPDVFAQAAAAASPGVSEGVDGFEDDADDMLDDEVVSDDAALDFTADEIVPSALHAADEDDDADRSSGTLAGLGAPQPAPILARKELEAQQLPLFKRDHQTRPTTPELGRLHLAAAAEEQQRASYVPDDVYVDEQRARELLASSDQALTFDDEEASLEEVHAVSLAASQQFAASEQEQADDSEPPPDGALMRVLGVFAMVTEAFRRGSEWVRELAWGVREDAGTRVTGGRTLFGAKPRRVTGAAQRDSDEAKRNVRVIAIGTLCILALVVFAYLLTPAREDTIPHRDVRSDQTQSLEGEGDSEGETETTEASALAAAPLGEGESPAQPGTGSDTSAPSRTGGASASTAAAQKSPSPKTSKPSSSAAAAKTAAAGSSMVYGQRQVPNPRRFLLRMAEPVRTLLGTSDADGFSVVIMDNKALDKAAPIAVGHPDIEYSAILNRRDHSAELTVRFAPGKRPAYRVSGQGSTLEVLLAQ